MNEPQRLFLVQARTDIAVFKLLKDSSDFPVCHALHYLQMATEMFGKALAWKQGPRANTHMAFVGFLRSLSTNRQAQQQLGYERRTEQWIQVIRKSLPLAKRVEDLAPTISPDAPNPEYPWPRAVPHTAPAEYTFSIWSDLQETAAGQQFLSLVDQLFSVAAAFL
jgi:hypothetical protein